jgi:hypothetical protein
MKARIVTGYVPDAFPAKHLSQEQFRSLGERLKVAAGDCLMPFETPFDYCWLPQARSVEHLLPSCLNPPADRFATPQDMVRSNAVLLQRFYWLYAASRADPDAEVFAWVEWSALKQTNVNEDVIRQFAQDLQDVKPFDGVCAGGCWPMGPINDSEAHWRFVGSCFVVHADWVKELYEAVRGVVTTRTTITGRLSWDMNTLAFVELLSVIPFKWFAANHDEKQFLNYRKALA